MLKFFRRKNKRSEWMKGLLACELSVISGKDIRELVERVRMCERIEIHSLRTNTSEKYKGYYDYLEHYETTLADKT
jgi:hypothetical protein